MASNPRPISRVSCVPASTRLLRRKRFALELELLDDRGQFRSERRRVAVTAARASTRALEPRVIASTSLTRAASDSRAVLTSALASLNASFKSMFCALTSASTAALPPTPSTRELHPSSPRTRSPTWRFAAPSRRRVSTAVSVLQLLTLGRQLRHLSLRRLGPFARASPYSQIRPNRRLDRLHVRSLIPRRQRPRASARRRLRHLRIHPSARPLRSPRPSVPDAPFILRITAATVLAARARMRRSPSPPRSASAVALTRRRRSTPRRRSPPTARARLLARTAQNLSPVTVRPSPSPPARARASSPSIPLAARSRPERLLPRIALTVDSRPIRQIRIERDIFLAARARRASLARARDRWRGRWRSASSRGRRTVATFIDERGAERRRNGGNPRERTSVHASRSSRVSREDAARCDAGGGRE